MAFVVWGLLAACTVYWGLQALAHPVHVSAMAVAERPPAESDLSRLLGARPATAVAVQRTDSRFTLLGVVAPKADGRDGEQGLALIAVDGTPRTVRVGAVVDGEWRLRAVERRAVRIAQNDHVELKLELAAAQPLAPSNQLPPAQGLAPQIVPQMPQQMQQSPNDPQGPPAQPGTRTVDR